MLNFWMGFQVGKARRKGHQNSLELKPIFFVMTVLGGIQHPLIAAGLGLLFVITRFFYFKGYSTGVPDNRLKIGWGTGKDADA
ncbi:Glutathione transferase protein [Dioscorea alata]|uniref:Glutathione transferase protein n=1 Tax=Dioscorea alata TaxID=55571 RepID=A0ACB7UHV2_DIOAL|nr:Glutathione transferase protein [Dioscorea alata]